MFLKENWKRIEITNARGGVFKSIPIWMGAKAAAPSSLCHLLKKWPLTRGRRDMAGPEAQVCLRI